MRYLCPHHLKNIAADPIMAMTLWQGAMENGLEAKDKSDWQAARSFFGAAFETAVLHNNQENYGQGCFTVTHLIDASHHLSDVLQRLNLWEEAQMCLQTIQNGLLQESIKPNSSFSKPEQLLNKTQEVVNDMLGKFDQQQTQPQILSDNEQNNRDSKIKDNGLPSSDITLLISSTLYLMTRYALNPTKEIGKMIVDHLERVFKHSECESDVLTKTCQRLSLQWQAVEPLSSVKNGFSSNTKTSMIKAIH